MSIFGFEIEGTLDSIIQRLPRKKFFLKTLVATLQLCYSINRHKNIRNYLDKNKTRKLHLGCGTQILESWLNTDLCPNDAVQFLDVTKKFPFDDCVFDYVFSEHLIEHLEYPDGKKMLRESYRVLKPGGKIRIATPDLKFLISLLAAEKGKEQENYMEWMQQKKYIKWVTDHFLKEKVSSYDGVFVINNAFRNWGHKFIYDSNVLQSGLKEAGFDKIKQWKLGESGDPKLRNIESHGRAVEEKTIKKMETFVLEATKPLAND